MKTAYFDLIAGASGDMILGALIDAGLSVERLKKDLSTLNLTDFELQARHVTKNGFSATKVDISVKDDVPERHLPDIEAIITHSELPALIQEKAIGIFRRLGEVEAFIHGTSLDKVHLHELGGVDTIVDVVGTLLGIQALGIQQVTASPIPLGRGFIRSAHGQIPLPAPATAALLKGVPITGMDLEMELVTPTGAALITTLADSFGQIPSMTLDTVGYGAGGRDLPIPNLLRVFIGDVLKPAAGLYGKLVMLETNIDDLNPEFYNYVLEKLFQAGALDVFFTPIQMKKNRPATLLQVLANSDDTARLRGILFEETSTLGVRQWFVERYALERETREVTTPFGMVRVKIARLENGKIKIAPEFEDCRTLAERQNVPLREVYDAAMASYKKY